MSKHTTELFNINGTATMTVDTDCGVRAHMVFINNGKTDRCIFDVMSEKAASNVKSAINFLLKDKAAQSVRTEDGLTVGRGKGNDK